MPNNIQPGGGGHKDQSLTIRSAINAGSVTFIVLRVVSSSKKVDFLNLICFTVKDAVFVLRSAPGAQ